MFQEEVNDYSLYQFGNFALAVGWRQITQEETQKKQDCACAGEILLQMPELPEKM